MRIVFVCTGNMCRSPFAEAVARRARPELDVGSAGVAAFEGASCPPEAIEAAAALGVDLSGHRARLLDRHAVAEAHVLVGMDRHHLEAIRALGGAEKARLLAEVPILDPYGGNEDDYRRRYGEIDRAVRDLVAAL